jgi:hypothetical protein
MTTRCRWHKDQDVPGGRFLVPGCWNRVINGDAAECHCRGGPIKSPTPEEMMEKILDRLEKLETTIAAMQKPNRSTNKL